MEQLTKENGFKIKNKGMEQKLVNLVQNMKELFIMVKKMVMVNIRIMILKIRNILIMGNLNII